jgi:signal transduction histidine kinase
VNRIRHLAREYWFELLIAVLGIAAMAELIIGRDSPGAPSTPLWFEVPAVAALVLPLFARRRFPFAAPAAYWLIATALSFVDGLLIPFMVSLFPIGLASAFLLGNLRDVRKGWLGLAIVLGGITTVVNNVPGHLTAELLFIPVDFGIAWAAGFALRERAEKAEAAEMRAAQAEREREAAARVAVAEERSRIARAPGRSSQAQAAC